MSFFTEHPLLLLFAGLLILLILVLKAPIKLFFKLLLNTVVGFAVLLAFNYFGSFIGISLPVNWINAIIIGILGIPGVAVVAILNFLAVL